MRLPGESLCGTQVEQFRKKYGIIPKVSDRSFLSNSFHVPVWANVTPIEKQDIEERFFAKSTGGRIQYVRIPNSSNPEATQTLIERGIRKGFYQGVNLAKSWCDSGHEFFENAYPDFDGSCPICGSKNITTVNRVCRIYGFQ